VSPGADLAALPRNSVLKFNSGKIEVTALIESIKSTSKEYSVSIANPSLKWSEKAVTPRKKLTGEKHTENRLAMLDDIRISQRSLVDEFDFL